jgi:hypothetical protein
VNLPNYTNYNQLPVRLAFPQNVTLGSPVGGMRRFELRGLFSVYVYQGGVLHHGVLYRGGVAGGKNFIGPRGRRGFSRQDRPAHGERTEYLLTHADIRCPLPAFGRILCAKKAMID